MLAEWVSEGAIFGVKAFFAVVSFMLCMGTVTGLIMMLAAIFQAGGARND